jgi:hypothetical protein
MASSTEANRPVTIASVRSSKISLRPTSACSSAESVLEDRGA